MVKIKKKNEITVLTSLFIIIVSSIIFISNIQNAQASTPFSPIPNPPATGNEFWDFDEGDILGWRLNYYENETLELSQDLICNVSDIVFRNYEDFIGNYSCYLVELTGMFWNITTNSLQEYNTSSPLINASATNFTNNFMTASDSIFLVPPFIHNNGTSLAMNWSSNALMNWMLYNFYIPNPNITIIGNETYIDSTTSNSYMHAKYDNHGILETGELFLDLGAGNGNYTYNYTRIYDFNPLDDLEWGVDIGDFLYSDFGINLTRFEIVDIVNISDFEHGALQNVMGNYSVWNSTLEVWEDATFWGDHNVIIGSANDNFCEPNLLITKNTTGADLAPFFSWSYDEVTYGPKWIQAVNTISGDFQIMKYFNDGTGKYFYGYDSANDTYSLLFRKNITSLTLGTYNITYYPYDYEDIFNITTTIQVSSDTDCFYGAIPYNPTNVTLEFEQLYFDMVVNESANLVGQVNLTINYNLTYPGPYYLWYFNESTNLWESNPLTDNGMGTLNATLDHLSLYGLTRNHPPSNFTLSSNAGAPDKDGNLSLTWSVSDTADNYSIYNHSSYITDINGTVNELANNITSLTYPISDLGNGTYYYKIVAFNEYGNGSSNCIQVIVELGTTGQLFDGMYISHAMTSSFGVNGPSNYTYTYYGGSMFNVTWNTAAGPSWYDVDERTRIIINNGGPLGYVDGSHDPGWIFNNVSIGTIVQITSDAVGDLNFNISGELIYNLPGFGLIKVWVLDCLTEPTSHLWYEQSTGILLNGTFSWGGGAGFYSYAFVDTNVVFTYVANNYAPELINASVTPTSGFSSTLYNFTVTYIDLDNLYPSSIDVVINGTPYAMSKQNPGDNNYTDGCIYEYSTYLSAAPFNYTYYFNCSDWGFSNWTMTYNNLEVNVQNFAPPELLYPQVDPPIGTNSTIFNFTVWYYDTDNNLPTQINITINETVYSVQKVNPLDFNAMDGIEYYYSTSLDWGYYRFRFNCSDGGFLNWTSWNFGPVVDPFIGASNITIFEDDFESGLLKWVSINGLWHKTNSSSAHSNPYHSFENSIWYGQEPTGNFDTGSRNMGNITSIQFDLSYYDQAYLEFYHWKECENFGGYDISYVKISIDGLNWDILYQIDVDVAPWQNVLLDISQYCGNSSVQIMFHFDTVDNINNDFRGWLIDDVKIYNNGTLSPLFLLTPNNGSTLFNSLNNFSWTSLDASFGNVNYTLQISDDLYFGSITYEQINIHETPVFTNVSIDLTFPNGIYYWRVRPTFGTLRGNWSEVFTFNKSVAGIPPELIFGTVDPLSSYEFTLLNFTVVYYSFDNNTPIYVNVTINGTSYEMVQQNLLDNNYTDGCLFEYITILSGAPHNYSYYFICYDGTFMNWTSTYNNLQVLEWDYPVLIWADVFPEIEIIGTTFNISALVTSVWGVQNITAIITWPDLTTEFLLMYDDGLHDDNSSGDGIYGVSWDSTGKLVGLYNVSINASDIMGYWIIYSDVLIINATATDISSPFLISSNINTYIADSNFNNTIAFNVRLWDPSNISVASANIRALNGTLIDSITLFDDGNHYDGGAGNNVFGNYWYSGINPAGIYYIDIFCNDTYSNNITFYQQFYFVLVDWNLSINEVLIYNVTYNNIGPFLNPMSQMPVGYMYRVDIKDLYTVYKPGLNDIVWRVLGNSYELNGSYYYDEISSMSSLLDANISLNYYKDYVFFGGGNLFIANIIPTPVCNWTFKWLEDSGVFDTYFPKAAYSYVYTDTSINIYLKSNPDDINITMYYNSNGVMSRYYMEYYNDIFEMVLILDEINEDNGNLSNPTLQYITSTWLNFTVTYTNSRNIHPLNVRVWINGLSYYMYHLIQDFNYIGGTTFSYIINLANGLYDYAFSFFDGLYSLLTSTQSTLVGYEYPELTDGYYTPVSGNQSTWFRFYINYTDDDNDAPTYVRAIINGIPYAMTKVNPSDTDYTDGCIYNVTLRLQGNYTYYFTCHDGLVGNSTSPQPGPIIEIKNLNSPTLSNGNVSPDPGELSVQDIYFNVTYTDLDNNEPLIIVMTLDGVNYTMEKYSPSDMDCTDGCIYYNKTRINSLGVHNFNFTAWDGQFWTFIGGYSVTIQQTSPCVLSNGTVMNKTGRYGFTIFNFTVNYTDADNVAPAFIYAEVDGINYTMTQVNPLDINYVDGCLFNLTMKIYEVGNITYQYWASDGLYIANDGPYNNLEVHAAPMLTYYSTFITHVDSIHGEVNLTEFKFTVIYTDYDNDTFTYLYLTLDGNNYTMLKEFPFDNDYTNGVLYYYTRIFNQTGVFMYNFTTSDGVYTNFTGSWTVDIHLTNAPTLTDCKVEPIIGEILITQFNFTVNYTDIDNQSAKFVRIKIDGIEYEMSKLDPSDNDFTDGCIFFFIKSFDELGVHFFNFTAEDPYYSAFNGTYTFTVQQTNPPTLSSGQVNPISGDIYSTLFNFTVIYTDIDNDIPIYINVTINGIPYSMVKVNALDVDYTDGCLYYFNRTFAYIGNYSYEFTAYDGLYVAFEGPYSGSIIQITPPTLTNGAVSPNFGRKGITLFNFTVNYTDVDNLAPLSINITLDGINYAMSKVNILDTDYTDGCIYYFNLTLNIIGPHEFNFTVFNGANLVFLGTFINPFVSAGPVLSNEGVTPSIGEQNIRIFNFTVSYSDEENDAPVDMYLTLGGNNYSMIKVNPLDTDYTDGCLYYYTTTISSVGVRVFNFTFYDGVFYTFSGNFFATVFPEINWSCSIGTEYYWQIRYCNEHPDWTGSYWIYNPLDINLTTLQTTTIYGSLYFSNRSTGLSEPIWPYFTIEDYDTITGLYKYYEINFKEYMFIPFLELPIDIQKVNDSIVNFYFKPEYGLTPTTIDIYVSNYTINYEFNHMGTDYRYLFQWNSSGLLQLYKRFENGFMQYYIDRFNESIIDLYDASWVTFDNIEIKYIDGQKVTGTFNISVSAPYEFIKCSARFELIDMQTNTLVNYYSQLFLINNTINKITFENYSLNNLELGDYYYRYSLYYYDGFPMVLDTGWQEAFEVLGMVYNYSFGDLNLDDTVSWNAVAELGSYLYINKNYFAQFTVNITNNVTAIDFTINSHQHCSYLIKLESDSLIRYENLYMSITGAETFRLFNIPANVYNISLIGENTCELRDFIINSSAQMITEDINFLGVYSRYGFNYFIGLNGTTETFSIEFNYTISADREVLLRIINISTRAIIAQDTLEIKSMSSSTSSRILVILNFPITPIDTLVEVNLTFIESGLTIANNIRFKGNSTLSGEGANFNIDLVDITVVFEQKECTPAFWATKQINEVEWWEMHALEVSNITILEIFLNGSGQLDNVTIIIDIKNKFNWDLLLTTYSVCYDVFAYPIQMDGEIKRKHIECLIGGESERIIIQGVKIEYIDGVPTMNLEIIYEKSLIMNILSLGLEKIIPAVCGIFGVPTFGIEGLAMEAADLIYDLFLQSFTKEDWQNFLIKLLGTGLTTYVAVKYGISGTEKEVLSKLTERYQNIIDLAFDWAANDPDLAWKISSLIVSEIYDYLKENQQILVDVITYVFAKAGKTVTVKTTASTIKNAFAILSILDVLLDAWIKLNAPETEYKKIYASFNDPYPGDFSDLLVTLDPAIQVYFAGPTAYSFSSLARLYNIINLTITNIHWNSTHSYIEISALTNPNYTASLQMIFEDLTSRNSLLSMFARNVNISYFVKNGNLLKIYAYTDILQSQTRYSINSTNVIGFQEFHFDAIQIGKNHYRFAHTFNYVENKTFVNQITLLLPAGVSWIQSNVPYDSWIGNVVTWNTNITNLVFEFKIQASAADDDKDVETPPFEIPIFLIIIIGMVGAVGAIIILKARGGKSEKEKEYVSPAKVKEIVSPKEPKKKVIGPLPSFEKIKFGVLCAECSAPAYLTKNSIDEYKCKSCSSTEYKIIYRCDNCNQLYSVLKNDFLTSDLKEKIYRPCPACLIVGKLVYEELKEEEIEPKKGEVFEEPEVGQPVKLERRIDVKIPDILQRPEFQVFVEEEEVPMEEPEIEEEIVLVEEEEIEEELVIPPAISPKALGLVCINCSQIALVPEALIDKYECPACGNKSYKFAYYCTNCDKNFQISLDDYIKFGKPKSLSCPGCDGDIILVEK